MEARASRREPLRTCVACRAVRPKGELFRLVLRDGEAVADPTGAAPGRGAYVCRLGECAERARGRLAKALRASGPVRLSVPDELRT